MRSLADNHKKNDSIYLFGFSRGAFTVRAVAGFVHRCGLPNEGRSFDEWFTDGFALYSEHFPPVAAIESFRERSRLVEIDFLGLWDTVKSYGGLVPISWPHLRHNPSVKVVRHALALNEQRAWFQHTTWGYVNEKLCGVPLEPDDRYRSQDVEEVWFRGYHSDIGGGKKEKESARVALLWMLGDSAHFGLRLNDDGKALFDNTSDFDREIDTHDSYPWWWPAVGLIPRQELHNECRPPRRALAIGGRVRRDLLLADPRDPQLPREVLVHVSALGAVQLQRVRAVRTRPFGAIRLIDGSVPAAARATSAQCVCRGSAATQRCGQGRTAHSPKLTGERMKQLAWVSAIAAYFRRVRRSRTQYAQRDLWRGRVKWM